MTVLAVLVAVALLVLISVVAGLIGFAALGALGLLEGGLAPRPALAVTDRPEPPERPSQRGTSWLVDTTCRPGPTRL